jgi:hypothetical protein
MSEVGKTTQGDEELARLRLAHRDMHRMLWVLICKAGGEVCITATEMIDCPRDCVLERMDNIDGRAMVLRAMP